MNCKNTELYMDALLDDQIPMKDSIEIIEHVENCSRCKAQWVLNEETRVKLKHFIGSIKASSKLEKIIYKNINEQRKLLFVKPFLIAASLIFCLGMGLFINNNFIAVPNLFHLHSKVYCQLFSNDIATLSKHVGINLKDSNFSGFQKANFTPHGAAKFTRPFNRNISLIALKNDKGQKISLCFLPKEHYLNTHQETDKKTEINGTTFHHGTHKNFHYAYWKQNDSTIALISNELSSLEMIELAMPLVNEV